MRLLITMRAPQVRVVSAARMIAILEEMARFIGPTRAEIHSEHRLDVRRAAPADEFVGAELVGLGRGPRQIQSRRPLIFRADPVFPVVAGEKVAAGIAHDGYTQLARQLQHVLPEAILVRSRVARLVDPAVDTTTQVFDERAEHAAIEG